MAYANSIMETVRERFTQKRKAAEETVELREYEAGRRCPEILEISRLLDSTGLRLLECASLGKDGLEQRIAAMRDENAALHERRCQLLVENGFPPDYLSIRFECDVCCDTGIVDGKQCACFKKALAEEAFRTSGLGARLTAERFYNFDLSYYSDEKVNGGQSARDVMRFIYNEAKKYADTFAAAEHPASLLFVGKTGLGKTHLSSAIAFSLIEQGTDVIYETVQNVITMFERKTFHNDEAAAATVARYLSCELLIIDDLGTEFRSSFTQSVLYELLNTRINAGLPMIVSTNLADLSDFKKQYDDRIVSRLIGSFRTFKFVGEDVRIQKVKQGR